MELFDYFGANEKDFLVRGAVGDGGAWFIGNGSVVGGRKDAISAWRFGENVPRIRSSDISAAQAQRQCDFQAVV